MTADGAGQAGLPRPVAVPAPGAMSWRELALAVFERCTRGRRGRIAGLIAVFLVVASAAVFWGPVGLGNGPMNVQMEATVGWRDNSSTLVGFTIPLYNAGQADAV